MESNVSRFLFVYSSLRKGFHHEAYNYITQFFNFVSEAKVKGILSEIDGEPFASPGYDDSFIIGELYELKDEHDFSFVFGQLDDYEGVIAEPDEEPLYRREIIEVHQNDGEIIHAWIYWYNRDVTGKPRIPSGDVLEYKKSKNL